MKEEIIQLDRPIDYQEINSLTDSLLDLSYEEINQKFNHTDFFQKVFNLNVDYQILLLRELIINDFTISGKNNIFSNKEKDKIIEILANSNDADTINISLKKINQFLILPNPFNYAAYQVKAKRIHNAIQNIKRCIADEAVHNYYFDVNFFLKIDPTKLDAYLAEDQAIASELIKQYEKLIPTGRIDNGALDKAIKFISHCGRTQISVTSLKIKNNLGVVAEIILKIERSIKIVQAMRAKSLFQPTSEQIMAEIKEYIINDTQL